MFQIYADASNILKIRLGLAVIFNVIIVATFSHAGQILIDEVSRKLNFSLSTLIEIFSE
jgi:AAA15 family ATPase/GTPase